MSKVIAVFGTGPGLGAAVAQRFGREGYKVALVARRKDKLDSLVAELAKQGIEAAAFPANLSDTETVPSLIQTIRERFGRIDVVQYAPVGDNPTVASSQLSADFLRANEDLYLHTPVEIARAVLPRCWNAKTAPS